MENKSQLSVLYDIVCTFCVVAVIASGLSFTLPSESQGALVAQSFVNFSSTESELVNTAQVSLDTQKVSLNSQPMGQLSECSVIGGDADKGIVILDCAESKDPSGLGSQI